jgi:6-phosphogluconolactonase
MKTLFLFILLFFSIISKAQYYRMLVGTYNTDSVKNGIYLFEFNKKNGASKLLDNISLSNPSFITVAPKTKNIYSVLENATNTGYSGSIAALQLNKKENKLVLQNTVSSLGNNPCHITTDATERYVVVANYSSGNFCTYSTNKDGSLENLVQNIPFIGSSKDTTRQKAPHTHGVFFNKENTALYVTDLGIDKVMCYNFNSNNGINSAMQQPYLEAAPGSGPRHLALHPNGKYMYILQELTAMVSIYYQNKNEWVFLKNVLAQPINYTGKASGAQIIISKDGAFLYTSNRGTSNTITIFKINKKNGALTLVGHQPSNGLKPRNINFDPSGNYLLAANQDSNTIVIFKRDKKTGLLEDTNQNIQVPKPVCITWVEQ